MRTINAAPSTVGEILYEEFLKPLDMPPARLAELMGVVSENGIYGHSRFCNTDFDDKLACLNLSGV
ncbi:hypothetical protein [Klebsiella pneumoniae]|uniref:hypothetical protein n=1 Tax=Klebsiella pneumoniae TaxID=573 RepID=UPI000E2CECA2|nr:hypothetical protein [Klebsiella pneumoniae]SXZ51108.1 integrase [Klebsiella pneumoniae]